MTILLSLQKKCQILYFFIINGRFRVVVKKEPPEGDSSMCNNCKGVITLILLLLAGLQESYTSIVVCLFNRKSF